MRSKWINRVLSVALLFTTLTTSVSYTFTTAYAEEAGLLHSSLHSLGFHGRRHRKFRRGTGF